ncbi:DUF4433 domain-containing protein [Candidatus Thiosymbion oneisti]|uniref:DUF4433 domain-containing protein n=1 Tax=Candidatus Thiosymbion oneisti TaxID=589554 RepID=UPI000ADDC65B|nr:DUF4433 domain-containing protein [Candidatus Thiosymbion oneisti]
MTVPTQPKVYHIVHVDRLPSIIQSKGLWCDAEMVKHPGLGTTIGMNTIKSRRLYELTLNSRPGLYVGNCVPFYFCPRSIMLYLIHRGNHPELSYRGGEDPIVHLEFDLRDAVAWAEANDRRWAFTLCERGFFFF